MVQYDSPNVTSVCEPRQNPSSRGIFFDDNPFDFAVPVLCAQLSISALINAFLQLVLSPIGETAFISQMWVSFTFLLMYSTHYLISLLPHLKKRRKYKHINNDT